MHKTKHCVLIWKKPKYQWYINTIINQTCLSLWESAKLWWPKFVHICSVCFYIVKTRFLKSLSLCENSDDKIQQPSSQAWICYFCRYDGVIIINNITNVFITRLFQRIQSADYFYCKGVEWEILKLWDLILSTTCNFAFGSVFSPFVVFCGRWLRLPLSPREASSHLAEHWRA